jgi:hypothetical protein
MVPHLNLAASPALNDSRRPLVMVLGMHRSGTSLCANILARLGIDMAEDPGISPANRRGHWERPRINDLHDQILGGLGRGWSEATHHLPLPEDWLEDHRVRSARADLLAYLQPRFSQSPAFGIKDPRTARLLPLWRGLLRELGADPVYVVCVRDPSQVARSITARDHLARDQAAYRWLIYNAHLVHGLGGARVCIVPYEHWFSAPDAMLRRLAQFVRPDAAETAPEALAIVDASLRHDDTHTEPAAKPVLQKLHRLLLQSAEEDRFGLELRRLAANILEVEQTITPLLLQAAIAQVSVAHQNRVIGDLNSLIQNLRAENMSLRDELVRAPRHKSPWLPAPA